MAPPVSGDEAADDSEAPLLSPAEGAAQTAQLPRWYTPKRLLALFCVMQFMVYMDRGVRAPLRSRLSGARKQTSLACALACPPRTLTRPAARRSSPAPA